MSTHLHLAMGDVTFSIEFPPTLAVEPLQELYQAFLNAAPGDWVVRLCVDPTLTDDLPPQVRHTGQRTYFRTMSHAGWVDLASQHAEVSTPSQARVHSALVRVLSFILMQVLPRRGDGLLLHGAGVVLNGQGHVFFGASGKGKSTISRLLRPFGEVLTDENVILRLTAEGPRLASTPFWGLSTPAADIQQVARREVPLVALYELAHTPDFELSRLSAGRATMGLLTSEKVAIERVESADAWLNMVSKFVQVVPIYRLGFRPTTEVALFLAEQGLLEFAYGS